MSQKKYHARGFNEAVDEQRAARVGFKRYLRELEEQSLLDDEELDEEQDDDTEEE